MTKFIASILFIVLTSFSYSQKAESTADRKSEEINHHLSGFHTDSIDVLGMSTEDGLMVVFRDTNKQFRLIALSLNGESGKSEDRFYFSSNELFLVKSKSYKYNVPFTIDSSMAKELGSEPFDEKKTTIEDESFYFTKSKLQHWIGPDGKSVTDATNVRRKEKELHDLLDDLRTRIENRK